MDAAWRPVKHLSECSSRPAGVYLPFLGVRVLLSMVTEVSSGVKIEPGA